jgi:uncharacterized phage protein (TIGR01671 family)
MKRRIKFRIWNEKTKAWIHGPDKRNDLDGVNLFGETILLGCFLDGVSIEDLNEIVSLQYTGLQDKDGKEIFEGDFIELKEDNEILRREVVFEEGYFGLKRSNGGNIIAALLWPYVTDCKVIGNIYDNPELNNFS